MFIAQARSYRKHCQETSPVLPGRSYGLTIILAIAVGFKVGPTTATAVPGVRIMAIIPAEGRRPLPPPDSPVVVPPINFSLVVPGIYRSGHPNKKNFSFLRRLNLKGIMYVEGSDEYRKDSMDFVNNEGLQLWRFDLSSETVSLRRANQNLAFRSVSASTMFDQLVGPVLVVWEEDARGCT